MTMDDVPTHATAPVRVMSSFSRSGRSSRTLSTDAVTRSWGLVATSASSQCAKAMFPARLSRSSSTLPILTSFHGLR